MKKLYLWFYDRIPVKPIENDDSILFLNETEREHLKHVRKKAWWWSAIFCLLGYIFLFVPYYIWRDHLFPKIGLELFGITLAKSIPFLCYGWLLGFMEVWALVFLNVWCVHQIAVATGYMKPDNKHDLKKSLMDISLEVRSKEITKLGINPLEGLKKYQLFLFNTWLIIRGLLASMLIRVIVSKILGQYAFRVVLDFSGFPLFAWLNIRGTDKVYRNAKVIFMGQNLIGILGHRFRKIRKLQPDEKALVYDTLQYVAVSKRDFHRNHYFLSRTAMYHFHIEPEKNHPLPDDYLDKLAAADRVVQQVCAMIIVTGFVLDGGISVREQLKLLDLNKHEIMDESYDEMTVYLKDFMEGKGVEKALHKYLPDH